MWVHKGFLTAYQSVASTLLELCEEAMDGLPLAPLHTLLRMCWPMMGDFVACRTLTQVVLSDVELHRTAAMQPTSEYRRGCQSQTVLKQQKIRHLS